MILRVETPVIPVEVIPLKAEIQELNWPQRSYYIDDKLVPDGLAMILDLGFQVLTEQYMNEYLKLKAAGALVGGL